MKHIDHEDFLPAFFAACGVFVFWLFAWLIVAQVRSNNDYFTSMAAHGYIECPQVGSPNTVWTPSDACPVLKTK